MTLSEQLKSLVDDSLVHQDAPCPSCDSSGRCTYACEYAPTPENTHD